MSERPLSEQNLQEEIKKISDPLDEDDLFYDQFNETYDYLLETLDHPHISEDWQGEL